VLGAVYGALIVSYAKTAFSEAFPELWLFAMGALFIAVVVAFPNGLAGLWASYVTPVLRRWTPASWQTTGDRGANPAPTAQRGEGQ
jgi:urea transport system permease protein